jgi:hypothetical protein
MYRVNVMIAPPSGSKMNAHGTPHASNADLPTISISKSKCDDKQSSFPISSFGF